MSEESPQGASRPHLVKGFSNIYSGTQPQHLLCGKMAAASPWFLSRALKHPGFFIVYILVSYIKFLFFQNGL